MLRPPKAMREAMEGRRRHRRCYDDGLAPCDLFVDYDRTARALLEKLQALRAEEEHELLGEGVA